MIGKLTNTENWHWKSRVVAVTIFDHSAQKILDLVCGRDFGKEWRFGLEKT